LNLSQQIKTVNIPELLQSAGVELRQRGNKWVSLCPLHQETTPSFYIYPNNRWWCFGGCGGGDAVDFLRLFYGYDFTEALRHLGINGQFTAKQRKKIELKKKVEAERIQRERDLIHTLSVLIRASHKFGRNVDLLPAWEWYHDVLSRGDKEEKTEVIEGLKNWPTISRNYLFRPDFNFRGWLRDFLNGVQDGFKIKLHFEGTKTSRQKAFAA
jgi:hypothetical protein